MTFSVSGQKGTPQTPVLQVAVHGATHYHLYWDIPAFNGITYSHARYMARHGYTVLAIDQLGAGASAQPDGDTVTLPETASALHQVLAIGLPRSARRRGTRSRSCLGGATDRSRLSIDPTQFIALHFSRSRLGQRVDELYPARILMGRETRLHPSFELCL